MTVQGACLGTGTTVKIVRVKLILETLQTISRIYICKQKKTTFKIKLEGIFMAKL